MQQEEAQVKIILQRKKGSQLTSTNIYKMCNIHKAARGQKYRRSALAHIAESWPFPVFPQGMLINAWSAAKQRDIITLADVTEKKTGRRVYETSTLGEVKMEIA